MERKVRRLFIWLHYPRAVNVVISIIEKMLGYWGECPLHGAKPFVRLSELLGFVGIYDR